MLCSCSRHVMLYLVLVQPRKHPDMTENSNQGGQGNVCMIAKMLAQTQNINTKQTKSIQNKFSFLKEGLPSLKTACAPCMLGSPPKLVIVLHYTNTTS